jgi:SAM-dependent methyltransferase
MTIEDVTELKQRARATWAAGDYDAIAEKLWAVGERIVQRAGVGPGDEVLDVACGTGNAALAAAAAGGRVVGFDLTPELFERGRARAAEAGVEIEWIEGDAEALPFGDAGFDVVLSTFGAMFAPRHEVAAQELARVLRPGGRIGLCNWTPEGFAGDFFRTVGSHLPPPPDLVSPPTLWGSEDHVSTLFVGMGIDLGFEREEVSMRFDSVEEAVETYATKFGPVVKARELLEPQGRWAALRGDLTAFFARHNVAEEPQLTVSAEYLVVLGHKRR